MVPPVVAVLLWKFFYDGSSSGVFNSILGWFGLGPYPWLQNSASAMPALVLEAAWAAAGSTVIIHLAALTSVAPELYDAAAVDGASIWHKVWHVTMPQLRGVLLITLILQLIGTSRVSLEPYLFTGGGPSNSTLTVLLLIGLGPLLWLAKAGITPTQDTLRQPMARWPNGVAWSNLSTVWNTMHLGRSMANTVAIAAGSWLAQIVVAATGGYVLSVLRPPLCPAAHLRGAGHAARPGGRALGTALSEGAQPAADPPFADQLVLGGMAAFSRQRLLPAMQLLSVRLPVLAGGVDLGVLLAAPLISTVAPIMLFLLVQRLFLRGAGLGAR